MAVDIRGMFRVGHALQIVALALLTLGVVMVNSAGLTVASDEAISVRSVLLSRPVALALMSVIAMRLGAGVPLDRLFRNRGWRSPVPWIVIGSIGLLLCVHVPGIGREVNGAKRWVDFGVVGFQPSEIAKWGLPIVIAWFACRRTAVMHRFWSGFVPPMLLVGVVCLLIATEDLGTAVLIGAVAVGMLVAAGARLWHVGTLIPPVAAAIAVLMIASPYRIARVQSFMDPYADPQGSGYHMLQSMAAVSGGGLAGRGLGNSVHKFGYLPEDTTDFIFAIICEELGLVGAAITVFLYAALLLSGLVIVRAVRHPFTRLLGLGILLTIGLQALINMAVVTGTAPTKGIALPLLSSGGTGWILTAFSIGLLVRMDRRIDSMSDATPRTRETTSPTLAPV